MLPCSDPCLSLLPDLNLCLSTQTSNLVVRQCLIREVIIDRIEHYISVMSELFYYQYY